jgi:hypothetical protein
MNDDAPDICFISSTRSSLARARFDASYELSSDQLDEKVIPKSDCTFRKDFKNIQTISCSQRRRIAMLPTKKDRMPPDR